MAFKLEHTVKREAAVLNQDKLSQLLQKEITLFGSFFNNKKKEDFYTELSVLLKAGIHLREGLALLAENQKKEKARAFFSSMQDSLISGKSFSEVLQEKKEFTERIKFPT